MKLEKEELRLWLKNAYNGGCHYTNTKNNIDIIDIDAIYEILHRFESCNKYNKRSFEIKPIVLYSNSGVKDFMIICHIGTFRFLIARWVDTYGEQKYDHIPTGFEPFLDWLYDQLKPLPDLKIEHKLVFND